MQLELVTRFESQEGMKKFWSISVSEEGMKLFSGFGMIPGIINVHQNIDGTNKIQNSDGTFHRERILEQTTTKFIIEMDQFQGLSSKLFNLFQEHWVLSVSERSITRTFVITPKNYFASLVIQVILRPQLKIAMRRNMVAIGKAAGISSLEI